MTQDEGQYTEPGGLFRAPSPQIERTRCDLQKAAQHDCDTLR